MIKKSMCIVATEQHLMEKVCRVLVMTSLEVDNPSSHTDNLKNDFLI